MKLSEKLKIKNLSSSSFSSFALSLPFLPLEFNHAWRRARGAVRAQQVRTPAANAHHAGKLFPPVCLPLHTRPAKGVSFCVTTRTLRRVPCAACVFELTARLPPLLVARRG